VYFAATKYQLDRHIWDVPPEQVAGTTNEATLRSMLILTMLAEQGRITYVHNILFILAANATHVSWLCFYYRLTTDSGIEWFRGILHASVAGIIALFAIFLALAVRLCL
jgi:hypothetical protein